MPKTHTTIYRRVYAHTTLIGYICKVYDIPEQGQYSKRGSFFVQVKEVADPGHCHNYGINYNYMPKGYDPLRMQ